MNAASLHPDNGARMVIERASVDDSGARYVVRVYEPDGVLHEGEASCGEHVTLRLDAPEWTKTFLERLLKSLRNKHREDGDWPRKLTRWRHP